MEKIEKIILCFHGIMIIVIVDMFISVGCKNREKGQEGSI